MNDEHRGQLAAGRRGPRKVALDRAVALGRRDRLVTHLDTRVVLGHLLGPCVIRFEAFPQRHRRDAPDGELLRAIEELTAADVAVLVFVEEIEQLLRVI